jgi:hypothetical protein
MFHQCFFLIGLATTILGFGVDIFSFVDFGKSMTISTGIGKFTKGPHFDGFKLSGSCQFMNRDDSHNWSFF